MHFSPLSTTGSSKAVMVTVENIAPFFLSKDYETIGTTVVLNVQNASTLFTISLHPKDARHRRNSKSSPCLMPSASCSASPSSAAAARR